MRQPPCEPNSAVSTLRRALSLIASPCRWHQGGYFGHEPSVGRTYCVLGALYAAAGYQWRVGDLSDRPLDDPHFLEALTALAKAVAPKDVVTFNDAPETRHQDVLDAYRRAIGLTTLRLGTLEEAMWLASTESRRPKPA